MVSPDPDVLQLEVPHQLLDTRVGGLCSFDRMRMSCCTEYLFLSRDPLLVSLHPDPRFQRLVEGNRAEMARQRAGVLEAMREG